MRNLEQLIAEWRKTMLTATHVGRETLDELENHLRENVDQLVRSGLSEAEAFQRALSQLGSVPTIESEFQKLNQSTWLPVKAITGIGLIAAMATAILLIARFDAGRTSFLLASHVFTVTLGYTSTFLVGALGICFVGQRCFSDLSPLRVRSIARFAFKLGCVAAGLTAVGVILGMVWAKAEWERYWAWYAREVGGMAVLVWQACFLFAHRSLRTNASVVLAMSVVGNVVVSLAWFGPHLLDGLPGYGTSNYSWFLLAAAISNLAVFLAGLAPARWLRLRKAES